MSKQVVWPRGITFTSSTLADHGDAAQTGDLRFDTKGRRFVLVKNNTGSSTTIADGALCKLSTGQTTTINQDVNVIVTSADTSLAFCVNNTGAAVADGYYFWALQVGRGYGIAAGTVADGVHIAPAAAGAFDTAATDGTDAVAGIAISDAAAATPLVNAIQWNLPAIPAND